MYVPQGPPLKLHMPTSWQPAAQPVNRGGTWLDFEWAITWREDERATIVPATRLYSS